MLSTLDYVSCLTITVACYLIGYMCKQSEKVADNYIPIVVIISGAVLGIAGHLIGMADMPSSDIISSAVIGAWSGAVSIGANQLVKQLSSSKKDDDKEGDPI